MTRFRLMCFLATFVIFFAGFPQSILAQSFDASQSDLDIDQSNEDSSEDEQSGPVDSGDWNNWSDLSENSAENNSQLEAVPVVDPSGMDEAMEQALRDTMIDQAQSYYPMIRSMNLESNADVVTLEIAYQAASEKDLVSLTSSLNKEQMFAQLQILSPLLQKSEAMRMEGDLNLIEFVQLITNPSLSATLGPEAQIAFIQKVNIKLLKPVRMSMKQLPGLVRLELRPYLAGEEGLPQNEQDEDSSNIVFGAPDIPQTTAQVFGQSFQNQREYEDEINFGGETTLLEQLERKRPRDFISTSPYTNYSSGILNGAAVEDERVRSPQFGSIEYWKKHLSGALTNTARLLKRRRNEHFILVEEPAVALIYQRQGVANVRLGYNFTKQYPFFNQKQGRLAPADGVTRNDFQGGVRFITESPWTFSLQNRLGIFTHENTASSSKFGDRLNQYRYEAGISARYGMKRGFVQLGAGVKFETQEVAIRNRDIESYLSLLWYRPLSKKLAGKMEYNYTHQFVEEGQFEIDENVHKVRLGVEYKPTKRNLFNPTLGIAFYDGESILGLIGKLQYAYFLSDRDRIDLTYSTDFIRNDTSSFGQASLNNRRSFSGVNNGDLIRYHKLNASYERKLSQRMSGVLALSFRNETALNVEPKDKFQEYRLSVKLRRQISKKWVAELSYALAYLDAHEVVDDSGGGKTKSDKGNTEHQGMFRIYRYFGEAQ